MAILNGFGDRSANHIKSSIKPPIGSRVNLKPKYK